MLELETTKIVVTTKLNYAVDFLDTRINSYSCLVSVNVQIHELNINLFSPFPSWNTRQSL